MTCPSVPHLSHPRMSGRLLPMDDETAYELPFFTHRACAHFPCHEGIDPDAFNCLYCYCPLYALGPDCGGNFSYTEDGVKDCSACTLPHEGDAGGRLVAEHFDELKEFGAPRE